MRSDDLVGAVLMIVVGAVDTAVKYWWIVAPVVLAAVFVLFTRCS